MNEERDLLVRAKVLLECVDTAPLQDQADLIVREITELLAQPEQDDLTQSSTKLQDRIKDYLSMGGLFNPELVNHDIVRDLILDARAELLTQKREPLREDLREDLREGISLRDHFAALAMQGILANAKELYWEYEKLALTSYEQADAMLKERGRKRDV